MTRTFISTTQNRRWFSSAKKPQSRVRWWSRENAVYKHQNIFPCSHSKEKKKRRRKISEIPRKNRPTQSRSNRRQISWKLRNDLRCSTRLVVPKIQRTRRTSISDSYCMRWIVAQLVEHQLKMSAFKWKYVENGGNQARKEKYNPQKMGSIREKVNQISNAIICAKLCTYIWTLVSPLKIAVGDNGRARTYHTLARWVGRRGSRGQFYWILRPDSVGRLDLEGVSIFCCRLKCFFFVKENRAATRAIKHNLTLWRTLVEKKRGLRKKDDPWCRFADGAIFFLICFKGMYAISISFLKNR